MEFKSMHDVKVFTYSLVIQMAHAAPVQVLNELRHPLEATIDEFYMPFKNKDGVFYLLIVIAIEKFMSIRMAGDISVGFGKFGLPIWDLYLDCLQKAEEMGATSSEDHAYRKNTMAKIIDAAHLLDDAWEYDSIKKYNGYVPTPEEALNEDRAYCNAISYYMGTRMDSARYYLEMNEPSKGTAPAAKPSFDSQKPKSTPKTDTTAEIIQESKPHKSKERKRFSDFSLKEALTGSLGAFGSILYFLISAAIFYIPFIFLPLPWWAEVLIIAGIIFIPYVGTLGGLAMWIWAFFCVLEAPFTFWSVLYFIVAGAAVLLFIAPIMASLFGAIGRAIGNMTPKGKKILLGILIGIALVGLCVGMIFVGKGCTATQSAAPADNATWHRYVGSTNSKRYHRQTCRFVKQIDTDNIIWFSSEEYARSEGYAPCIACFPE